MTTGLRNHAEQGFAKIPQVIGAAHLAQARQHGLAVASGYIAERGQAQLAQGHGVAHSAGHGHWRRRCCERERRESRVRERGWIPKRHAARKWAAFPSS